MNELNESIEGMKHDQGKARMDLLPMHALTEVAEVMGFGASKYGAYNWQRGMNHSRYLAAALRHLAAYAQRVDADDESKLPHLAHAAANILMLIESNQLGLGMDDRGYTE